MSDMSDCDAMSSSSSLPTPTNKARSFMWRLLTEQVLSMDDSTRMPLSMPQPNATPNAISFDICFACFDSDLKF